ncbi:hypothetical protein CPB83DRAFT_838661 [Crepidotus variabilis]|uniref:F-box domain-containing protein n=1 Tax=Crepidotus variabilis TaxID=179855 RepID=A0A9P6E9H4_9AGAR|nr:hypothetical protein CPB83DRAFT_838661 [Crepidotus variabilis]
MISDLLAAPPLRLPQSCFHVPLELRNCGLSRPSLISRKAQVESTCQLRRLGRITWTLLHLKWECSTILAFLHQSVLMHSFQSPLFACTDQNTPLTLQPSRPLPSFKLYADLLGYIFVISAGQEVNLRSRRRIVLSYAQTCHDWREAALLMKGLWVQLADFDEMSWVWNEEMLRRSHPLSFTVGTRTWSPRDAMVIGKELRYLERINTYRLGFTSETWPFLVEALQHPAKRIEYLSLAHVPAKPRSLNPHPRSSPGETERFMLPGSLFSHSAPRLQHLKLEGCFIDLSTPLFRQLTSLAVLDIDSRYNTAPTFTEWADLLATMPLLVDLSLKNAIMSSKSPLRPHKRRRVREFSLSPTRESDHGTSKRIERHLLSSLQRLYIDGPLSEVTALLRAIILPGACEVALVCTECHAGEELEYIQKVWVQQLLQSLDRRRKELNNQPTSRLPLLISASHSNLCLRSDDEVFSRAIATVLPESRQSLPSESISSFYLDMRIPHDGCWKPLLPPILSIMCDSSVLYDIPCSLASTITTLEVAIPSPHLDLLPFLAQATHIEALVNIQGGVGGWLLEELKNSVTNQPEVPLNMADEHSRPLLPKLRSMSFLDDRCLYGSAWKSLHGLLSARAALATTSSDPAGASFTADSLDRKLCDADRLIQPASLPICRLVIHENHLPDESRAAMEDLGVYVVRALWPRVI